MNICVFGLWHLGLVTSSCLAKLGHKVVGLDLDKKLVKELQKAQAPLYEPGLDELIAQQRQAGKLSFSYDAKQALKNAQVLWLAIDTPVDENDVADIIFLENNFKKIMAYISDGTGIIVSSQAPVGFIAKIEKEFTMQYPHKKCYFACSPENLKLGRALDAFLNPDRIIIGIKDQGAKEFFSPLFSSISNRLEWMKIESAEMTKHAINSFLAISICFANEIASICEQSGAEAKEVERGLKTESRIGPKAYLSPGVAFSGGTLTRDINFLIKLSDQYKLPSYLIKSANESNSFHKNWIERKCLQSLGSFQGKTIAILGLTYKPGTDTLRRSFAVELAKSLNTQGASVIAYDPIIKSIPKLLAKTVTLKQSLEDAVRTASVIIIANECPEFLLFDEKTINLMKDKIIIDPNGFIAKLVDHRNLNYISVGKNLDKSEFLKNALSKRPIFAGRDETMKLKGRVAIITGANQGLGEAIAVEFVKQGADVMICARGKDKLMDVKKKLESICAKGQKVRAMVVDVSKETAVQKLINTAITEFKRVDILVNNAGIHGPMGPIEKVNTHDWVKAIEINLGGVFYCCKHMMPHMKKNNYGKIINLSGGGATAPFPFISSYAASKAGIVRFTETLAGECNGFKIDVNAMAPGALNTRLLDEVLSAGPKIVGKNSYEKAVKQKKDGGVPLEVGVELSVFLASRESDGITGRLISAKWDPWKTLANRQKELMGSDIYTLRRITPEDRGKKWD